MYDKFEKVWLVTLKSKKSDKTVRQPLNNKEWITNHDEISVFDEINEKKGEIIAGGIKHLISNLERGEKVEIWLN